MKAIILKCSPFNQFRLGVSDLEQTLDFIHSDTLFSSLINTCAMMYGKQAADACVEAFENDHIRLSSAFHCLSNRDETATIFFLPRPAGYELLSGEFAPRVRNIRYLSTGVWQQMQKPADLLGLPLLGETYAVTWEELNQLQLRKYTDSFTQSEAARENKRAFYNKNSQVLGGYKPVDMISYPKVSVHQPGQESAYYTQTNLQLMQLSSGWQTHFYFLLDIANTCDAKVKKYIEAAIHILPDEGIGGDRSTGTGLFEGIRESDFPLAIGAITADEWACNLSLSIPASQREFDVFEYYQFIIRGGGSLGGDEDKETHRRQVRMIAEGSMHKGPVSGSLQNVSPEKKGNITRNGKTLSIPVKYEHQ
ncbi:MAG: hypothetical protein R3D00_19865 [Bacteroidia bacterium]